MTSLLPPRSTAEVRVDLATRRPLVLTATLGGVVAAGATLLVCLALGVVGWFLTDGGAHGTPRDGLRVGALGWLMGHGSGVRIEGAAVGAVPLGLTLLAAWTVWRVGVRVGIAVSGHGPDFDEIGDGQRDLVVPLAGMLLTAGYVLTAVVTGVLAATPATAPSLPRVVVWSVALGLLVGVPALAVGSGRAAIWAATLPEVVRASARVARRTLVLWLAVSLVAFLVALVLDFSTAANIVSQLHPGAGAIVSIVVLCLLVLPNAVVFAGAYLLGPGFAVGTGTVVSPGAVVLGPLPAFPLLAALPGDGATAAWAPWLMVVAPVVALVAAATCQRTWPTLRWEEGATHGLAGGVVAGVGFAVLAALAGGAVGPGRMADVGPFVLDVLLHAVPMFGLGGVVGGLAMTWWQRRTLTVEVTLDD